MDNITPDARITFHPDFQVMEADFSELCFDRSRKINQFYDELEQQLEATGQKWFFLVNYRDTVIMPEAWIAHAHRGKNLNIAYSLGSARFAATGETTEAIQKRFEDENADPNLFLTRDEALAHLLKLREQIPAADYQMIITKEQEPPGRSFEERIAFDPDHETMEVDFSGCTFATSADVNAFYDSIGTRIEETGRKWYFMVNYEGAEILPDAWYRWYLCGKRLNSTHSLGTVRISPHDDTREEIVKRARTEDANPNVVGTRADAVARIADMRAGAAT